MKFHWFHLVRYPGLPEDFKQRYRSVWVDAPSRELYDPAVGHQAYNDYLDELEFAGDMGFDVVHVNLHKTFSTPHGGGGPGSGPVGVTEELAPFLPVPRIISDQDLFRLEKKRPSSIGPATAFTGNVGVILRAWGYIRMLGAKGLRRVSDHAVLNARYMLEKLKGAYKLAYEEPCMHEFVMAGLRKSNEDIHTMDVAKRLIDLGLHPPTVYFPLIVPEALMIEPTETESRETIDLAAEKFLQVAEEAQHDPQQLKQAPQSTPVGRLDEVAAARKPILAFSLGSE